MSDVAIESAVLRLCRVCGIPLSHASSDAQHAQWHRDNPRPMTLATAKAIVKGLGLRLVKINGEYQVKDGVESHTYFTDDIGDAVGTAHWMARTIARLAAETKQ